MANEKSAGLMHHFGILWLRVLMGTGIAYHGYGKVIGGQVHQLIDGLVKMNMPMPEVLGWAAALSEFLGGILIALGLFTRTAALFVFITMSVAVFMAHKADALQVKELALAYWTISGALIFIGGGIFGLDSLIKRK
jgi:putative oxidoreductase